jgi:hypothetical protein
MIVMRDEMNWPMAEIINNMSDQNLHEIHRSGKRVLKTSGPD